MGKYYSDEAKIVWNGNEIELHNRQAFQTDLPDTNHNVECFDIHPVLSNSFSYIRNYNYYSLVIIIN